MRMLVQNIILVGFIFMGSNVFSQIKLADLHYRNDTLSEIFYLSSNQKINSFHSSVKPYVLNQPVKNESKLSIGTSNDQSFGFKIYPLVNLSAGYDNITQYTYTGGAGLGLDLSLSNFYVTGKFLPFYNQGGYVSDSITHFSTLYPGASRAIAPNVYFNSELMMAFKANKFFTLIGGYGKNFFGDGYRSLLLSDNAPASPFFKIETSFSSIKYVNFFQVWQDIYEPLDQTKKAATKFSASHYLSWNITNNFNLSIFETVVMQGKDTTTNRGFDVNYLNPVVFYRPVEYSLGSSDNVLLGLNMSFKTYKKSLIYYQLILDEFLLSELKARSRWWANKYGMQIGYKAKDLLIDDLYFQTEFNFVRPFTYSHKYSAQNYGHLNSAVAHPIGANFYEVLGLFSYKKGAHQITNKLVYSGYGIDTNATNYGQNIFHSYADRPENYDQTIMQGLKTNVFNNQLIYEYALAPEINLFLFAQYNYRYEVNAFQKKHNHYVFVGLKSRIWNKYNDF